MLYIASDHGGFKMKQGLVKFLQKEYGDRVEDLGPDKFQPTDDYPKFAEKVAKAITDSKDGSGFYVNKHLGILLCRSGQGMCIAANRFKGVRAVLAWNTKSAKASRQDDLANVLCLPADYISLNEAKKIVSVWLSTPWGKEKRFERRAVEVDNLG